MLNESFWTHGPSVTRMNDCISCIFACVCACIKFDRMCVPCQVIPVSVLCVLCLLSECTMPPLTNACLSSRTAFCYVSLLSSHFCMAVNISSIEWMSFLLIFSNCFPFVLLHHFCFAQLLRPNVCLQVALYERSRMVVLEWKGMLSHLLASAQWAVVVESFFNVRKLSSFFLDALFL